MATEFLKRYLKNGLLGHYHNQNLDFVTNDNFNQYRENLKTQPVNWFYRDKPIQYSYNSLGFRCIDHTFLQDNYILFTGCSFTEGLGLHYENCYPYLVAKNLNKTFYNLAIGGSGIDFLKSNLIMFLSLMKQKLPDIVVIQWPNNFRTFLLEKDSIAFINSHGDYKNLLQEYINNDKLYYTNLHHKLCIFEFLKNLNINKVIEIGKDYKICNLLTEYSIKYVDNKLFEGNDFARDLNHPGIIGHQIQAKEILDAINSM